MQEISSSSSCPKCGGYLTLQYSDTDGVYKRTYYTCNKTGEWFYVRERLNTNNKKKESS